MFPSLFPFPFSFFPFSLFRLAFQVVVVLVEVVGEVVEMVEMNISAEKYGLMVAERYRSITSHLISPKCQYQCHYQRGDARANRIPTTRTKNIAAAVGGRGSSSIASAEKNEGEGKGDEGEMFQWFGA